jgi:hypothetical protein
MSIMCEMRRMLKMTDKSSLFLCTYLPWSPCGICVLCWVSKNVKSREGEVCHIHHGYISGVGRMSCPSSRTRKIGVGRWIGMSGTAAAMTSALILSIPFTSETKIDMLTIGSRYGRQACPHSTLNDGPDCRLCGRILFHI